MLTLDQVSNLAEGCEIETSSVLVIRKSNGFELYEVPPFGGELRFDRTYDAAELRELVQVANSWT